MIRTSCPTWQDFLCMNMITSHGIALSPFHVHLQWTLLLIGKLIFYVVNISSGVLMVCHLRISIDSLLFLSLSIQSFCYCCLDQMLLQLNAKVVSYQRVCRQCSLLQQPFISDQPYLHKIFRKTLQLFSITIHHLTKPLLLPPLLSFHLLHQFLLLPFHPIQILL